MIKNILKDIAFHLMTKLKDAPREAVLFAEAKYGDGDGEVKREAAVDYVVEKFVAAVPDFAHFDEEALIRKTVGVAIERAVDELNAYLKPAA